MNIAHLMFACTPHKQPSKYAYISWYILLFTWVQGIALLHISLVICILLSLPLIPQAFCRLKNIPWLWVPIATYETLRVISSIMAKYPDHAFIGLFDDVRAIIFGLLALIFIRSQTDLKHVAWITFSAFTFFAYWTLGYHFITHSLSLQNTIDISLGTFGSVNYAAAITSLAMLTMLAASILLPWKSARWMFLGIFPLAVLQIPLGSRTTILVTIFLLCVLVAFLRAWKASLLIVSFAIVGFIGLSLTPTGLAQFSSLSQSKGQLNGDARLPSIQIRWEIFQVLSHLSLQHPFGLGPHNHPFVDLNAERDFLKEHAKTTCKYVYSLNTDSEAFKTFNFNHPQGINSRPFTADPHSQYTALISETGPLGCILFLCIIAGVIRYSIPLMRSTSSYQDKLLGLSGILMMSTFILSGLTVVLIYQAGNILLFSYIAILALYNDIHHSTSVPDTN